MTATKLHPIYLFAGHDHLEIKSRLSQLENEIFPGQTGDNIDVHSFFAEDVDIETIISECQTYPVFSEKKMVKVFECHRLDSKKLVKYIETASDSVVLALTTSKSEKEIKADLLNAVQKKGTVQFFGEKSNQEAIQIIDSSLKEKGIDVELRVLSYLVEQEDVTTTNLTAIIEAIEGFCTDGKTLTTADIPDILVSSKIPSIFDFIESLFSNDIAKTLRLFHQMIIEDENFIQIISMIYRQLKLIWLVKSHTLKGTSMGDIQKKVKLPSFIVQKLKAQGNKYTFSKLENLFNGLTNLDLFIKSGEKSLCATQFEIYFTRFKLD